MPPIPEAVSLGPRRPWLEPRPFLITHLSFEQRESISRKRLQQLEFLKDLKDWDSVEDDKTFHQTRLGFAIMLLILSFENCDFGFWIC